MKRYLFLVLFLGCLRALCAFSIGADVSSCTSMIPGHGTVSTNPNVYSVMLSETDITTNENVTVTINSAGNPLKGFLIKAKEGGSDVYGKFVQLPPNTQHKCSLEGAVTHTSSDPKSNFSLTWVPPKLFNGSVVFDDYDDKR